MKIVIVGGTGLVGRQAADLLSKDGHQVVIASPSRGINTVTGEGLDRALVGAEVVVDVSNSATIDDQAAIEFFTRSAANLSAASTKAGVKHLVVLSIVGTDRVSNIGYFLAKVAQERAYQESGVPYSILRATQFFEFLETIAAFGTREDGSVRVGTDAFQPVASSDVAAEIARLAVSAPVQGIVELAGPERRSMAEFVASFLEERGDPRQVVADPTAGYFGLNIEETTLVPLGAARLGRIGLHAWIRSQALVSA